MVRTLLVSIIVIASLAGCLNHAKQGSGAETATLTTSATLTVGPKKPIQIIPNATLPGKLELTQCTGFTGSTEPYPKAAGPGQAPPGWEAKDPSSPTSYVSLAGYECGRISVGPYERGPVLLYIDSHTHADIPSACTTNRTGQTFTSIVNVLLVNDSVIADYLSRTFGMPALYADMQATMQDRSGLTQHDWSFGLPGKTPSKVTFFDDGRTQKDTTSDLFFWQRQGGIGALAVSYERERPFATNRAGYGTMQPPMILAASSGIFSGPVDYFTPMAGHGTFRLYGDSGCMQMEQPN